MPKEPLVDLEALLRPISDDQPAGRDLSFDDMIDTLKEARVDEDASLDQGDWVRETKTAEWKKIREITEQAITFEGKDLQVAAFLGEALARMQGFFGATTAVKIVHGLLENFWDTVYPLPEDGDMTYRVSRIDWMVRNISVALHVTALTPKDQGAFNLDQRQRAQSALTAAQQGREDGAETDRATALANAQSRADEIEAAIAKAPTAWFQDFYAEVNECLDTIAACEVLCDEKFGRDSPTWTPLKQTLGDCKNVVERTLRERGVLGGKGKAEGADGEESGEAEADGGGGGTAIASGRVRSRGDALARLAEVAEFFRKTEPHSPVSYLLDKAVRWGNMPLHLWLQEIIKDENILTGLREHLGIRPPPAEGESQSNW